MLAPMVERSPKMLRKFSVAGRTCIQHRFNTKSFLLIFFKKEGLSCLLGPHKDMAYIKL
jgi:hypothetical protein